METHLLAIQAHILLSVGLAWLAAGILWFGQDPFTVVWRAALGAFIAMVVGGRLLRMVGGIVEERLADDEAERRLAAEERQRRAAEEAAAQE
jgi:hypothetical protein